MEESRLTCEEAEILLQDYLDGYLLSGQREALEEHLSRCASCRQELVLMKKLEERLEESGSVEVPADLARVIARRLPMASLAPPWARTTARVLGLGLAASMALVLVVLTMYAPHRTRKGQREVEIVYYNPDATSVSVAGDFNDWNLATHPMTRVDGGKWRLSVILPPGLYQYGFYVNNQRWAENPGTQAMVNDGFGGQNALLFIEG